MDPIPYIGNFSELWSLIDRLNSTFPMGQAAYERARKRYQLEELPRINQLMFEEGKTLGEASRGPEIFALSQDDFFKHLKSIQDNLVAQVALLDELLDGWFRWGEPVPPHYPMRIAIILRKIKRKDLEATFLEAFFRHIQTELMSSAGLKLAERAEKLGVYRPSTPLHLVGLRGKVFNINMTVEWAEMVDGELKFKAISKCRICKSADLSVSNEGGDTRRITCRGCSWDLGMVGDALRLGEALAKEHLKARAQ